MIPFIDSFLLANFNFEQPHYKREIKEELRIKNKYLYWKRSLKGSEYKKQTLSNLCTLSKDAERPLI